MKLFLSLLFLVSAAQAGVYKLDSDHSQVGFTVKHLMVTKVNGSFKKFEGSFDFDAAKKELKEVNVAIDSDSIETGVADRDKHLKSDDFFNTKKFPKILFKSNKVEMAADGKSSKISGMLTMRDKTLPITLDVVNNGEVEFMGVKKVGFTATGKLNRKDYGVAWNKSLDKGGVVVSDEVTILIEGEANLDAAKAAAKK